MLKSCRYTLEGLDCANCAKKIEDKIAQTEGYEDVNVNFSTLKLSFKTEKQQGVEEEINTLVHGLEPDVVVIDENKKREKDNSKIETAERNNNDMIRLFIGLLIYFAGTHLNLGPTIAIGATVISLGILLFKTAKKAWIQMMKNRVLDENALITISAIGACFVDKAMEGVMVVVLYEIGKILEARAVNKTRKSITDLMDIKPEYANLKRGDEIKQVTPEEVEIGDIILVKTGEKIPLDGIIIKGEAKIDNSALTGESALLKVKEKDSVLSGGINVQGLLEIQVEKTYENSTVSQILNLVENATDKKAKTETFVAKAAKIYTPVVMVLAVMVAIFMPVLIQGVTYSESVYKALIFLVISCPCSIAISVPLSYFSGIGKASKRGILIKGSDYLDSLKDIREIVFDKTGTITTGKFTVSQINCFDKSYTKKEILTYFALGESFSNHPLAKSILEKAKDEGITEIDNNQVKDFQEIAGKGLTYVIDNKTVKIGNASLVEFENSTVEEGTVLYLKIEDSVIGNIIVTDEIKTDAKQTMRKLATMGIKTKMFTGDKKEVANRIAKEVGIHEVKAEMLPQNKYAEFEKVLEKNANTKENRKKVAFVGDGINDSPVLARADVGISMGGIGSSSAIEASDVVIMTDELGKIIESIEISKKTNQIIKQNLAFSIGVKLLILGFSLFGIADMWEAVFADVGTTLITIFNTIRILK